MTDGHDPEFDFRSLLKESVGRLKAHESREEANRVYIEDKTLVGLLDLTRDLLEVFISNVPYAELLHFI